MLSIYLLGEPRIHRRIKISTGGEGFDVTTNSQTDIEAQDSNDPQPETSDTSAPAVEDRPIQIPENLSEAGAFWNEILVAVIVVIGAIVTYFIIRYFLNRAADSLHIERGQLNGILSITKLALIVIAITVIIFQFSTLSEEQSAAFRGSALPTFGVVMVAIGTSIIGSRQMLCSY